MFVDVFQDRRVTRALILVVGSLAVGALLTMFQWNQKRVLHNAYQQKRGLLISYLRDAHKIPTPEEINTLKRHREYLKSQHERISQVLHNQEDFSQAFKEVVRPLEFRGLVAEKRARFERKDIGFSDYATKIPMEQHLVDLKRYLALIEAILELCAKNRIQTVKEISRLPKEELVEYRQTMLKQYPIMITLRTRSDQLYRLLYDISSMSQLVVADAIRIEARPNYELDIVLKLTYVEIPHV